MWPILLQLLHLGLSRLALLFLCLSFFENIAPSSSNVVSAISSKLGWILLLTIVCILSEYNPCTKQMFLSLSASVCIQALASCSQFCRAASLNFEPNLCTRCIHSDTLSVLLCFVLNNWYAWKSNVSFQCMCSLKILLIPPNFPDFYAR
jgi:hypothetical protein